MEHSPTLFHYLPLLKSLPQWVAGSIIIAALLLVLSILGKLTLRKKGKDLIVPEEKFNLRNFWEFCLEGIDSLIVGIMGEEGRRFLPLIGSLFIYILFSNLLGLIPGFLPPTNNLNSTLAPAIFVFLYYNACGFRDHGLKYIKHFLGPVIWLAPLMLPIELVSHCVRPVSLSLRLFGNITGDHMVLSIFSELIPVGIPVIFLGLGLFVSFMQAFVFSVLTMVYIKLAIEQEH